MDIDALHVPTDRETELEERIESLEEALEEARHYVASAWWNCNGGMQVHQEILDDLAKIDAALGRPFFHPNPTHRTAEGQAAFTGNPRG